MRKWMACGRWLAAWMLCGLLAACGGGEGEGGLAGLQKASLAEPQTGIWWNPSASGSGYAVERQGSIVTLGAYLYEADGRATWYVGPLARQSNGDYQGQLTRYAGGQSLSGTYRAPSSSAAVATVTFSLTTATSGSLAFVTATGSHTVPVQRFALTGGSIAASAASFESGLWWNDAESGRGFFIDVQGTSAALASYMYDGSGNPLWYLTVGTVSGSTFSGTLEAYQGGQALGATYRAPASAGQQGTVSFRAITATTGELTLPGGRVVPVKRLVFASSDSGGGSTAALEGVYESTVGSGPAMVLALDNGDVWTAWGKGSASAGSGGTITELEAFTLASGSSANGTYSSSSVVDIVADEDASGGTLTATYVAGVSFSGTYKLGQSAASTLSAQALPTTRYNYQAAASLSAVVGNWSYKASEGSTGAASIDASGGLTGNFGGCALSGTVTPRPGGKNVFNASVSLTGSGCSFTGSGVAFVTQSPTGTSQLWMGFMNTARTDGTMLLGTR